MIRMNKRTILAVALSGAIIAVFYAVQVIFFPGLLPARYMPKENEEIYGTWLNTEYSGDEFDEQKIVIFSGGCELYSIASIQVHMGEVKSTIFKKWTDSEGNIWYKRKLEGYTDWTELNKISRDGKTLESVHSYVSIKFPTELNSSDLSYHIYYRQKRAVPSKPDSEPQDKFRT